MDRAAEMDGVGVVLSDAVVLIASQGCPTIARAASWLRILADVAPLLDQAPRRNTRGCPRDGALHRAHGREHRRVHRLLVRDVEHARLLLQTLASGASPDAQAASGHIQHGIQQDDVLAPGVAIHHGIDHVGAHRQILVLLLIAALMLVVGAAGGDALLDLGSRCCHLQALAGVAAGGRQRRPNGLLMLPLRLQLVPVVALRRARLRHQRGDHHELGGMESGAELLQLRRHDPRGNLAEPRQARRCSVPSPVGRDAELLGQRRELVQADELGRSHRSHDRGLMAAQRVA
mmetsp:Transcript_13025/g.34675  ORF Transcript_13025/g.34675 Transcript_13025/m.34675 type:complete len:289 (+) Transcript_13025:301-1167(+)